MKSSHLIPSMPIRRSGRKWHVAFALMTGALVLPASAQGAAVRYTAPDAQATSGPCSSASPCRIDAAINGAAAGDEIIVRTGTYQVTTSLSPTVSLNIHGVADQAAPVLIGADKLQAPVLSFKAGGTLRHLTLQSTATGQDALTLQGGLAEGVTLISATGDGAKVVGAKPATVLRDAVVRTGATGDSYAGVKLRESGGAGDVALRNVTVMAANVRGMRCEVTWGSATLVNVLVRGATGDVDASSGGTGCVASHSNLRPELSPGLTLGLGIQSTDPLLVDLARFDFRPLLDSPTVNAGTAADPLLGAFDLDGRPRSTGGAPDIGAYEYGIGSPFPVTGAPGEDGAAPGGSAEMPADLADVPAPVIGSTIVVAPGEGRVLVRRPKGKGFKRLGRAARLPVGTVVDATRGRIRLVSAVDANGNVQTGRFGGGRFAVGQRAAGNGMTSLRLRGGDFSACPVTAGASRVGAKRRGSRRVVRSLWGRDRHGKFRTHGMDSVATTRGTAWVTRDRCDGTLTRVTEGAVLVEDRRTHKRVLVRAGQSHLAARR